MVLSTDTWTGAGNLNWSDPNDWASNTVPVAGDSLVFPTGVASAGRTSNNDLAAGTSFASLTIEDSGYTIGGNAVALTGTLEASQTSGSSTVNLPVNFGSTVGTVTVDTSGATLVLGGDVSGQAGLTKEGSGELELTAANDYTGTTTVSSGALYVNGSVSGAITVSSGATVGGTGTVGSITTQAATVSPGQSGLGILTDTGALTLDSSSNYDVNLDGTTPGSGYSQLAVGGAIDLASATLNVTLGSNFTPPGLSKYTILSNTGNSTITGTFAGISQGGTVTTGSNTFSVTYVGGVGNDIVLTALVPTTTTATFAPTHPVFGQSVALTATVTGNTSGFGTPSGSVDFMSGTTDLGSATVNSSGVATLDTTSLALGTNTITAVYSGDSTFASSTSSALQVTVAQATVTVAVNVSNGNPFGFAPVVLTATVAVSSGAGTPTGTVTFYDINGVDLGTSTLSNGTATLTVSNLSIGKESITAVYSGDTNFSGATSAPFPMVVGSQPELFINQVFLDVFGVPAGPSGNYWVALLNGASPRGLIVSRITRIPLANMQAAKMAFQRFVGRAPTSAELNSLLLLPGSSSTTTYAAILGSPAFFTTKGGSTNSGFLSALAQAVLGSTFPSAVHNELAAQLSRGVSRTQVAREVLTSPEGIQAQVNAIFEAILDRQPTRRELAVFRPPVRKGQVSKVVTLLLSSQEFYAESVTVT